MTMLIAVPTGVKFFNWIGTMWKGSVSFDTPMLWTMGFLITFLFGGLTGIILSSPPLDFHVSDSYFVVAHFHYTVFGTVVFLFFAGLYFWWPKMTGRMLDERLGKIHFWLLFVGFQVTFLIQHWLGVQGMPRRYGDYLPADDFELFNQISTVGAAMLGISTLFFIWNVLKTWRSAPKVTVDDPWGWGGSLEWATSCPPPRHNFVSLPKIRSERPAFDLHHPELAPPGVHPVAASAALPRPSREASREDRRPDLRPRGGVLHRHLGDLLVLLPRPDRHDRPGPVRRPGVPGRRSTSSTRPSGSTRARRTGSTPTSTRPTRSTGSSARTRGGRCRSPSAPSSTALGLIFAVWVIVLGVTILMLALIGWMFEYYRGDFAQ